MNPIVFSISTTPKLADATIVVAVAKQGESVALIGSDAFTPDQLQALGSTGKIEAVTRSLGANGRNYALVGIGSEAPTANGWREIGGAIGRALSSVSNVELELPLSEITRDGPARGSRTGCVRIRWQAGEIEAFSG